VMMAGEGSEPLHPEIPLPGLMGCAEPSHRRGRRDPRRHRPAAGRRDGAPPGSRWAGWSSDRRRSRRLALRRSRASAPSGSGAPSRRV
jgi:hypothetical protein